MVKMKGGKKMVKYCPICGIALADGVKFCAGCGAKIQVNAPAAYQQPPVQQPNQPMNYYQPPVQQYAPAQQQYTPYPMNPPKKSNKKAFAAIAAVIVVAIVVLALLFFIVLADGDDTNKGDKKNTGVSTTFIGAWGIESMEIDGMDYSSGFGTAILTFKSDGTYTLTSSSDSSSGTWETKNGKFYSTSSDSDISSFGYYPGGMDYVFSNGDNTLTLSYSVTYSGETHSMEIILKKTSSGNNGDGDGDGDGDSDEGDLLGSWELTSIYPPSDSTGDQIWTFYSNETVKMVSTYTYEWDTETQTSTSILWASYQLTNGQLCLEFLDDDYGSYDMCYDFELSSSGNSFTVQYLTEFTITFTKI